MNAHMAVERIKIWVQVHPGARRNEVQGWQDGIWQLKIAAPPVKGRANQELIKFLSDALQTGKTSLAIEKGLSSKRKLIGIIGLTPEQVQARLSEHVFKQK